MNAEQTIAPVAEIMPAEAGRVEAEPLAAKPVRQMRPGFRSVLIMGYGVLVPLVAMAMVVGATYPGDGVGNVLKVEISYAAALLSFLAGIRWGIALMAGGDHLRFRPLAALTAMLPFAWVMIFLQPVAALGLLMVGYLVLGVGERAGNDSPMPGWYRALLRPFTVLVEIALGLTLLVIVSF